MLEKRTSKAYKNARSSFYKLQTFIAEKYFDSSAVKKKGTLFKNEKTRAEKIEDFFRPSPKL
ncbi:hypothetical protein EAG08_06040 [Chryseobacterium sp. 3008163]|nr:hypothetical protein EAG08_06040 [Chryseobacterium sp. 3008163]